MTFWKAQLLEVLRTVIERIRRLFLRSDTKSRVLYKNVFLSLIVKGAAILVSLVNMPAFMEYFHDSAVLGLWFTMLSMLNWILTFDLGIGNGLRNYLAIALEKQDRLECQRLISSAYCSVGAMAVVLSIATFIFVPLVDWNAICNISAEIVSRGIIVQVIRTLLVGIWIQFFLKLVNTILYAMQRSAVPNALLLFSNILLLLSTFVLNTGDTQRNLVRLANAYVLTSNLPMLVATIVVFSTSLRKIKIRLLDWKKKQTKQIVVLGCSFLLLQLLSMASFNTREFYIMRLVDPSGVVPYQVYHKLFSLVSTFFVLATTPFWSAITQAAAQKDERWIRKTYKKGLLLFGLFSFGSVAVVILSQWLVNIWLGENAIDLNIGYSCLFVIFHIEYMWVNLHSHFENGLGKLRIQKIGYILAALGIPMIALMLVHESRQWIMILLANILALLPMCIMQPIYLRKVFTQLRKDQKNRDLIAD